MKKTSLLIMSMIVILVLAACGKAAAPAEPSPAAANAGTTAAASPTPAAAKEQRIASLSIHLTNHLLALGITPVGSAIGGDLKDFLPHVKDRLQNTKKLGVVSDPDMEALLALKPDVIFLDKQYAGNDLAKYEKIAPVQVFDLDEGTWRDTLKQVGKAVNREKQAEDFIKEYDTEKERVKGLIANKIGTGKVMAIRVTSKELRVFGMKRPMGPILFDDLKLQPAKGVEKINKAYEVISQEVLPDFDADAIFVVVNRDEEAQKVFKQLQGNPIWQGLKAVKQNHVYPIADQPWLDYSSLGSKLSMDEAENIFSK